MMIAFIRESETEGGDAAKEDFNAGLKVVIIFD